MLPRLSLNDVADRSEMNTGRTDQIISLSRCLALWADFRKATAKSDDFFVCEFTLTRILAVCYSLRMKTRATPIPTGEQAMNLCMFLVFFMGLVFKITDAAIRLHAVNMIDLFPFRAGPNESAGDD